MLKCKVVNDDGKRFRIEGDGWSMQPVGEISAKEAQEICRAAAAAITAQQSGLQAGNEHLRRHIEAPAWLLDVLAGMFKDWAEQVRRDGWNPLQVEADHEKQATNPRHSPLPQAVEQPDILQIVKRLRDEEARMVKLWEFVREQRDKNHGNEAFSELNQVHHAVAGRDPVLTDAADALMRILAEMKGAPGTAARYRHLKRGGTYKLVGRGRLQTTNPIGDDADLIFYQSEKDGSLWARPADEFFDGRFLMILGEDPLDGDPQAVADDITAISVPPIS